MGAAALLASIACVLAALALAVAMMALESARDLARVWKRDHDEARQFSDFVMLNLAKSREFEARAVELIDKQTTWMSDMNRRLRNLEHHIMAGESFRGFTLPDDLKFEDSGPSDN